MLSLKPWMWKFLVAIWQTTNLTNHIINLFNGTRNKGQLARRKYTTAVLTFIHISIPICSRKDLCFTGPNVWTVKQIISKRQIANARQKTDGFITRKQLLLFLFCLDYSWKIIGASWASYIDRCHNKSYNGNIQEPFDENRNIS